MRMKINALNLTLVTLELMKQFPSSKIPELFRYRNFEELNHLILKKKPENFNQAINAIIKNPGIESLILTKAT